MPFKEVFCQFTITLLLCHSLCKEKQFHTVFISHLSKTKPIQLAVASHAGDFRGACISSLPTTKYELP